jgi:protocatechuate 3,4-dioxygenase beta subunit
VTNSSGSGVTGVSVTATDPGGSVVESGPVTTASNGAYTLPVDTGTYDIHFVPAGGSGLNPIVSSNVTVLADQTLNVQLTPVTHTFSGTLTDANGSPIAGASLAFPQGAGGVFSTTDASGHFSITIKAGTYPLSVSISGHAGYPQSVGVSGPTIDLTSGDVTQDLQIPYQSTSLTVLAKDGNGAAAADVFVGAGAVAHSVSLASGLPASQVTDGSTMPRTDSAGSSVGTYFAGDVFAAGSICVNFGAGTGSICNTSTVTLNSATTVTISKPTTHTFSGIFNNASGNPLPNVTLAFAVGAGGVTSTTDAAGHFSITTTPTVHGLSASFSNVSGYPQSVGITGPGIDLTNGDITQNLQLSLPTATLTVNAIDANGNPVSSAFVSGGPQNVTAQLYPGAPDSQVQGVSPFGSTNSSGTASGLFFDGATFSAGNICVNFGAGTGVVCSTGAVTLNGSTSVTIRKPGGHTLSGTLTDANGNPIAGASLTLPINATSGVTSTTDASGHFSMTIQAGVHGLSGSITGHAGYPQSVQFTGPSFDLTSSDITQNLQLSIQPRTLTVVVKDANGNGVVDIPVNAAPGQITTQLFAGGTTLVQGIDTLSHTNTSGTTSGTYLDGAVFAAGSICANLGGGIGNICNSTPVTLNGNATLVLQQQPSAPAAPTNLSAVSPTMTAPALTWNTVSGATSYNVYRDGNAVGTSTAASYTDSAATEGSHVYTVKAVQAGVESAPSNAVTVILDKTRPVLNFTSPTSFAGPFSTGPFVTVTASDPGSGLNNLVIHVYTSANVLLNICGSATAAQLAAGSMSCDLSPLANGTYFVRAGSFDKAGNNRTINSTNFVIAR